MTRWAWATCYAGLTLAAQDQTPPRRGGIPNKEIEMEQTVEFTTRAAHARGWRPETYGPIVDGIEYNETFGEYIAYTMTGEMVFGQTQQQCYDNLREANRTWREHCQKC